MWVITENIIDHDNTRLFYSSEKAREKKDKVIEKGTKFRLLDDDDIVYFIGYSMDNSSFAPLDDLGESYGCVSIQYWENGEWEEL